MIPSEKLLKSEMLRLDNKYKDGLERLLGLENQSNNGHSFSRASWKLSNDIQKRLGFIYKIINE